MNLTRCDNGHFFDMDKHNICPHCSKEVVVETSAKTTNNRLNHNDIDYVNEYESSQPYYKALAGFESCKEMNEPFLFISYAHKDAERIKPFFKILEDNNFRYWYDEGLPSGEDYSGQIGRHIKCAVQFIVFMSRNAQNSKFVRNELHVANKHDKNILVVYIENFELDDGLELTIDRNQNLCAYRYNESEIARKFYNEISKDALKKFEVSEEITTKVNVDNSLFSKYTNIMPLTKSRMSEIYSAENINTGCKVVIKKIVYHSNQNSEFFYNCFKNEIRALKKCRCPFLPQLYDVYEFDGCSYIIEEYVNGESPIEKSSYSEEFVVDLGIKVAHILKYFLYNGIVHCDIKPNNIIVNEMGDVFLIDLGSSVSVNEKYSVDVSTGTHGFAAPEQFKPDGKIDFRTDIYGLGRTMLTLLVGDKVKSNNVFKDNRMFNGDVAVTCALNNPAVKPQYIKESLDYYDNSANAELSRIINKMVSPQKECRYFSIEQLINDLKNCRK